MPAIQFKVVIPARYASTRLPAKPLLDLDGKPMVPRVAERARLSGAEEVWIATDHPEVMDAAAKNGLAALLTRTDHSTGTDRLAEVVEQRAWDDNWPKVAQTSRPTHIRPMTQPFLQIQPSSKWSARRMAMPCTFPVRRSPMPAIILPAHRE